ncbi:MAG: hypothetical protein ACYTFV_00825 [Planctomycetota bacterium]
MNRTMRKYTKQQLGKALEGNLVADRETDQFRQEAQGQAEAALRTQQVAANEMAQASGEGTVQEDVYRGAADQAQKQASTAAVQASGQAGAFKEAATQARRAEALTLGQSQRNEDARRRQIAMKYSFDAMDAGGEALMGMIPGG